MIERLSHVIEQDLSMLLSEGTLTVLHTLCTPFRVQSDSR